MPSIPTVSFDPTSPGGSQAISLGDDRIRELKVQFQEVIAQDHKMAASGQSADTGFHNQVTFIEQASAPTTTGTNYIALYGKEINSKTELFLKDEGGTEYQLTKNGKLYVTNSDGLLAVIKGGTGLATVAQGDILYSTAADTLAALAKNSTATRYLSNTGTSNNPEWAQVNVVNGLVIASQAQGDIIYADSSTTFARLGAGTIGQALLTQGAGANPIWGQSGSLTLVSTTTISANTTSGNISITNTSRYMALCVLKNSASNSTFSLRFNAESTSVYQAGYQGIGSTSSFTSSQSSTSQITLCPVIQSSTDVNMNLFITPHSSNNQGMYMHGQITGQFNTNGIGVCNIGGASLSASTITSFVINCDQNYTGTIYLYSIV